MAALPEDAKTKFDAAWDNLNNRPKQSNLETPAEGMDRVGTAFVGMADGLARTIMTAQHELTSSADRLTAEIKNAADAADKSATALSRYTFWLVAATFLLFIATAALVFVEASKH
jgi:hypothetical protein